MSIDIVEREHRTAEQVKQDLERNMLKKGIPSVGTGLNHSSNRPDNSSWLRQNGPRLQISKGPKAR